MTSAKIADVVRVLCTKLLIKKKKPSKPKKKADLHLILCKLCYKLRFLGEIYTTLAE